MGLVHGAGRAHRIKAQTMSTVGLGYLIGVSLLWATLCENVSSGICGQRRPRSD